MNKSKLKKITSARLFLPIVCLIAVLLLNVIKTPDFFNVSIRNGVLYGYIIDVINRASELVILAIGMTLVTAASGGQDVQNTLEVVRASLRITPSCPKPAGPAPGAPAPARNSDMTKPRLSVGVATASRMVF